MRKYVLIALWVLGLMIPVAAQDKAVSTSKLAWDQPAPDLSAAQGYTYRYYPDGAPTGVALTSVACTNIASIFTCSVGFPAFTPGLHTLTLTASNIAGESAQSAIFTFTFVVVPGAPHTIHIQ